MNPTPNDVALVLAPEEFEALCDALGGFAETKALLESIRSKKEPVARLVARMNRRAAKARVQKKGAKP